MIVLSFLTGWEAVVVEVMVKEALEVAEVATVVVEEVATVVVVVGVMVKLPQGTLVEDSRCTLYKPVVQCIVRPYYVHVSCTAYPFALHLLVNAVTVRITYINALRIAHEASSPEPMQLATRQAVRAFAVHLYYHTGMNMRCWLEGTWQSSSAERRTACVPYSQACHSHVSLARLTQSLASTEQLSIRQ